MEKPLFELRVRPEHVVATLFLLSYLWFLPMYNGYKAYAEEAFISADIVNGFYDGGTIVCDYPAINYRLVHRWGVEPRALLGNHYSPHYYGMDEPLAYAEWLRQNDVTIWLKTDFRGEPVLEAVQKHYPGLFEPLEEVSYTQIYIVDQAKLESILGEENS